MEQETKTQVQGPEQSMDQTLELGSGLVRTKYGNIYILTIIGQIEGHQVLPETVKTTKYEQKIPKGSQNRDFRP